MEFRRVLFRSDRRSRGDHHRRRVQRRRVFGRRGRRLRLVTQKSEPELAGSRNTRQSPWQGHWESRSASVRSFNGRNPVMQKKLMRAVALAAVATLAASSAAMAGPPVSRMSKRSEEHTSELQSLMRISYAVFCLQKTTTAINTHTAVDSTTNTKPNTY